MRLLFICKNNRFRSKVAEAFFNKYNKNKRIKADSAGLHKDESLVPFIVRIIMKFRGAKIKNVKSKKFTDNLIKKTDLIINVANDVPEKTFKKYRKKIINWKIPDIQNNVFEVNSRINRIDKKVLELVNKLNN